MALMEMAANKYFETARERVLADPNADLSDLEQTVSRERWESEKRARQRILNEWFCSGLFKNDYEAAKKNITKCIALKPSHELTVEEAEKLLPVLWASTEVLFSDGFDNLLGYIETHLSFDNEDS
jgi:hypothetical protein